MVGIIPVTFNKEEVESPFSVEFEVPREIAKHQQQILNKNLTIQISKKMFMCC